ncbi:Thiol-disulfide isomerase/thioredoxin [Corynebacterium kutscheri]|uniref:Thiol-disulfide isomerase-like thioredoxin n=1 Tax=Corynebacterium kutscheri TaxID=35755 RepID=A0A0F6QYC8_9CORY|nr:TlpA disulfide reductase family protein [Corynebacterium kutscheri]AKE40492.1 thiol-disulfide isomerase-like thioredoxin [Corynebacterium kutscheri]VEH05095.1 Thiol-disulfide isomerase/thioredoxin [Corynebacterium kutscheri]VEH10887.1 Thiol-disulfide isomerase/thioredoxin [Corynebacterium kutscheri]VEH80636.1 Thiol-disulfide isomerase/thioredoxin [Corynebacterium kutscheri]
MNIVKLGSTIVLASVLLIGCNSENTAGTDAVAIGGTFQFYSPDGATEIFYPEEQRSQIKEITGDSLTEPGQQIALSDYSDQIVVLNAWGQWCAPCRSESDDLQEVQEYFELAGSGTVLGINIRDYNPDISRDFLSDNGITYPSIYDPPFKTAALLGGIPASVVPTTIVLDRQHRPAAVFLREITAHELLNVVKDL